MSWRPLPGTRQPRPLRDGLEQTMRHLRAPSVDLTRALFDRWTELLGDELAARVNPMSITDGELVVTTDDPAWASQLRWLSSELCEQLNQGLGEQVVTSVTVRLRAR